MGVFSVWAAAFQNQIRAVQAVGLWENKEVLRDEIKSPLPPATVRTEILKWCWEGSRRSLLLTCLSCATSESGAVATKWLNGAAQTRSTLPEKIKLLQYVNRCLPSESLPGLGFFVSVLWAAFSLPSWPNPAEQQELLQLRQLQTCQAALIVSQLQVQHLWAIQRNLPKIQSFTVFAFHWLPLISPFIRLNKTRFNSSYH